MRSSRTLALIVAAAVALGACQSGRDAGQAPRDSSPPAATVKPGPFESDLAFLKQNTDVIELAEPGSGSRVVVTPEYQGRVMTSTTGGDEGPSFGWIGRSAIAARAKQPHINVFGGEDRFWLGPEGGQYSLYFKKGEPFDLEHWQVPEAFDWGRWDADSQTPTSVRFRRRISLINYSGTPFEIEVDRTVRLLSASEVETHFGASAGPGARTVAFESSNTVTNVGRDPWRPASGLVSVWILGMFTPSPETTITVPFQPGNAPALGPIVNDAYFGKVPADRLRTTEAVLFFKGDGRYRSKIGLPPTRALSFAGSYDAARRVLTVVQYTRPSDATSYVNSMWEIQREPFKGDAINSYNDGPPEPGKPPLGPFYELETSSPALRLAPGESFTHVHRTVHAIGSAGDLDRLAVATLRVGVEEIGRALTH